MGLESVFEWKKGEQMPSGYWNSKENRTRAIKWLYENLKQGEQLTIQHFKDQGLGGLIINRYDGSPLQALQETYPDNEIIQNTPWTIIKVPKNYWDNKKNKTRAIKWLYENLKEGEQLTNQHFIDQGLGGLIQIYKNSPLKALQETYPDNEIIQNLPWTIVRVPKNYWDNKENKTRAIKWLYENLKEGEQIKQKHFKDQGLGGLIQIYKNSPLQALQEIYPDNEIIQNLPWIIVRVPNNYWDNKENRTRAIKWLYENLKEGEQIKQKHFKDRELGGLIDKYTGSPLQALQETYPNNEIIQNTPWTIIEQLPKGYWDSKENRTRAIKLLYENLKQGEQLTNQHFIDQGLGRLISFWYNKENSNGLIGLIDDYNSYFEEVYEKNDLEKEIKESCKCSVDKVIKEDIKLPLLATLAKYSHKNNESKEKNANTKTVEYKNKRIIKVEYLEENEWVNYEGKVNPNQFLNALIWGQIKHLSEADKEAFMKEKVLGMSIGSILLDELEHSTTGIESKLINQLVNQDYSHLMPKISIGAGAGNDLLENDIGIDINPYSEKIIQANALTYNYTQHKNIRTISFPDSLHSMPREQLLPKLKMFENFIITLPFNGARKNELIKELTNIVGNKNEETLTMRIKYTYEDNSAREKPISATILTPLTTNKIKIMDKIIQNVPKLNDLKEKYPDKMENIINKLHETYNNNNLQFDEYNNATTWNWAKKKIKELISGL